MLLNNMTAVFDLDGTITRRDTYIPFLLHCIRNIGVRNISFACLPIFFLLFKLGFLSNEQLKEKFLSAVLKGVQIAEVEGIIDEFVDKLIRKGLNTNVLNILNGHLKNGTTVILASASFDLYVSLIAHRLNIQHVLCTEAMIHDGVVAGRIRGKNCYGEEKVRRLFLSYAKEIKEGFVVYTDHYSDAPLIAKARRANLVHPSGKTLRKLKKMKFRTASVEGGCKMFAIENQNHDS